jgi:hypothetical protein
MLWPLLLLLLAAYAVETGGLAALQHKCGNDLGGASGQIFGLIPGVGCNRVFSFIWYIWALNFFAFALTFLTLAANKLHYMVPALTALWAVNVALQSYLTYVAHSILDVYTGSGPTARARAFFAGGILTAFFDGLLMLAMGYFGMMEFARHHGLQDAGTNANELEHRRLKPAVGTPAAGLHGTTTNPAEVV